MAIARRSEKKYSVCDTGAIVPKFAANQTSLLSPPATKSSNIGKRCWPIILHFRNIHNFIHCNFRNELTPHGVHQTRGEPIPPQHELRITIGNFPEKKKWNESPFNLLASPQVKTPNESESLFLGNGNQLTSTSDIAYQVSTVPKSSLSSFSASATSLTLSRSHRIFRAEKYVDMGRPQRCCMGSNSIPLNSRWVILGRLANDSRLRDHNRPQNSGRCSTTPTSNGKQLRR